VVVDRVKVRADIKQRLAESFETALRLADGRAIALEMDTGREHVFSSRFACPICSYSLQELEPRLFSFNNPMGACPSCDGLGQITFFDPKRVVAFPNLSLASGAIKGWDRRNQFYFQMLQSLAAFYEFDTETAFEELPPKCSRWCCTARARPRSRSRISTSAAAPRCASTRSKGSSRTWNAATAKPIRWPCARNWPSTRTTRPARPATARACAPRRAVKIGEDEQARAIYEINGCRCATR
jgi:excinuclease ABC subunit A